ncbi:hypothetical protein C7I84_05130 [Mesorhizobium ephedrae]|uniref:Uncharacterized protein n=2 Tax=Kumtagia ephedrae TaxID=2116701 RepID=A0A2P7SPB6_9HYPH|nr:hypothetical protein C7I84_05130 [Mesorhizobium ephedrae]
MSIAACLAASGCARMYDGTIVPAYTAQMVSDGMPRLETRRTDLEAPSRLVEFPPTPQPVASDDGPPPRVSAPRRQPGRLLPRMKADTPRSVQCRNEAAADGRIRVVCL